MPVWSGKLVVVFLLFAATMGCAGVAESDSPPEVVASTLPRTTSQSITITSTEQIETLPLPGCHTFGESGWEPPPGGCEVDVTVHEYTAELGDEAVTTSYHDDVNVDPLYAMQLVGRELTDGVSLIVVLPPPHAAEIRLVDSTGGVVDLVTPTDRLVALAGLGLHLTVEALSTDGRVIATCPPGGVVHDGIIYSCTLASGARIPVTTTTAVDI